MQPVVQAQPASASAGGSAPPGGGRLRSLDHLRGVAALVVVVHHSLMVVPALAATYRADPPTRRWSFAWVMAHTPLHALWDGYVAVSLFFVLSGYVLTASVARAAGRDWPGYYVRRVLRIYLPVFGAVALACAWIAAVARRADPSLGWWLAGAPHDTSVGGVLRDATLEHPGATTSVLWSLRWEIVFSLLLPVYVLVLGLGRRVAAAGLVLSLAVIGFGTVTHHTVLSFLPMFALGSALWQLREPLGALADRWRPLAGGAVTRAVAVLALASLLEAPSLQSGFGTPGRVAAAIGWAASAGACTLLVAVVATMRRPAARGERTLGWLGARSYSLYLVHEPLVVSLGLLVAHHVTPWAVLPLALVPSLALAEAFHRLVERPAQRLSRLAGDRVPFAGAAR